MRRIWLAVGLVLLALALLGCTAQNAEPRADTPIYQGSPTIVVNPECRENCGGAAITTGEVKAEARPRVEQSAATEAVSKSGAWIVWLVVLCVALIGAWWWWKKLKLTLFESKNEAN